MNKQENAQVAKRRKEVQAFEPQIERIRQKLPRAAQAPGAGKVFGAESHRYLLGEPLTLQQLYELEQSWGVKLPDDFAAFLTGIGNGGTEDTGGAGPYYGIYAIESLKPDVTRLGQPSHFKPIPASQDWKSASMEEYELDDRLDDDEYDEAVADLMRGTLEIGTQGCSYEMLLSVSGDHRGRVFYMDMDSYRPFFVYESNFLDWYERWLDEIIAGFKIGVFGMTPGGSEPELLHAAEAADSENERSEAWKALLRFPSLQADTILAARHALRDPAEKARYWALTLLASHAPEQADPLLMEDLESVETEKRRTAVQLILWYRKQESQTFIEPLKKMAVVESDEETFRFITYILEAAAVEPLPLYLSAFKNPNDEIREIALWQAGKSERKSEYIEDFIEILLHDPNPDIRNEAIQSLRKVTDWRLLAVYERLLEQNPSDDHDIRHNIRHRLKEYGFITQNDIKRGVPAELKQVREMLRDIGEDRR
ncbi:SMI1/KNR4 family protein [Saccharibacillus sacchari]|uniref:SMI1/KNR4 family protein n=1 Tax=Saccharibacillus sacchari TaxID=456493 RepID=A0ACC6PEY8_9BACL